MNFEIYNSIRVCNIFPNFYLTANISIQFQYLFERILHTYISRLDKLANAQLFTRGEAWQHNI